MKNKKGFTLVELLAVIVVLGIIMAIAGTAVLGQRKRANVEAAKNLEESIKDLGAGIYTYESSQVESDFMTAYRTGEFKISIDKLGEAGYLKDLSSSGKIKNPAGGDDCDGYLVVDPSGDEMFMGYINCPNLYATGQEGDDYDITKYEEINGIDDFSDDLTSSIE